MNKKIKFVKRNYYLSEDNYQQIVDLTFKFKTRNIGHVIDVILSEYLTDERLKEMLHNHLDSMKELLKLRFSKNKKIQPSPAPLLKSLSRKFFTISAENADKLDELSYVKNKPSYILLNEIICDYLKEHPVEK